MQPASPRLLAHRALPLPAALTAPTAQEAQQQLLAAVRGAVSERSFEASVYHHMATATVTLEQLAAADQHLRGLQRLLSRARRRDAAAAGGALAAGGGAVGGGGTAGGGGGGAEDDALMFDGEGADALP
jgi:hypothetical protein